MYGYIRQGRRTALTRELIGGVAFQVLTVGTGPLRRVRARRLLRRMARQGVSAAVFEDGAWREAAARYGIRPVPVGPLRLAKLGELLDAVCPALSGKTARLCTGEDGSTARRAARCCGWMPCRIWASAGRSTRRYVGCAVRSANITFSARTILPAARRRSPTAPTG